MSLLVPNPRLMVLESSLGHVRDDEDARNATGNLLLTISLHEQTG
jgi:hypothetical protein